MRLRDVEATTAVTFEADMLLFFFFVCVVLRWYETRYRHVWRLSCACWKILCVLDIDTPHAVTRKPASCREPHRFQILTGTRSQGQKPCPLWREEKTMGNLLRNSTMFATARRSAFHHGHGALHQSANGKKLIEILALEHRQRQADSIELKTGEYFEEISLQVMDGDFLSFISDSLSGWYPNAFVSSNNQGDMVW
jgi:hypothetical protein